MKDDDTLEDGSGHENKQLDNASFSKKGEPSSSSSDSEGYTGVAYQGSVYHVGVNRLGHHFCHPRFLRIRGTHVEMFKQDADSGVKPIRQGVAGQFLKVEDLGRRRIDDKDLYVLKISNSLDDTTKGEIACRTASDARKWRDAFLQAKDEAWTHFHKGSGHNLVDDTDEFNLSGHRPRLRRYAKGLTKLITIGSEHWFGKGGKSSQGLGADIYAQKQDNDTVDEHKWRCVCTVNGIRILEDASACMAEKNVILKSVGVIEASPSAIFEMLIDIQNPYRKEWDILTGDLKVVEVVNGHCDIVYGTFDPKYLRRWNSKRDFVFSRVWRHDPDNTYSILQSSTSHKDFPKKWGSGRITLNPTFWEIKPLPFNRPGSSRSQVTQTMEIRSTGWGRWKRKDYAKLDKTIPYVILCQIAGLRDYFASDPLADANISTTTIAKSAEVSGSLVEATEVADATHEEFYDAIAAEVPEEEEEDDEDSDEEEPKSNKKPIRHRFRNTALALIRLTSRARAEAKELVSSSDPVEMTLSRFKGSLPLAVGSKDSSCWMDPGGKDFMVRGKTYSRDYLKVSGGDPLLKLLAVDWLQAETRIDFVATNKNHLVQSESGKQLPFILVINLQVPAKPNYSLVFYFGAERPIRKGSLLDRFVNGNDAYRNSRFKLIPRIVEGYWFVKRAVGTKACLLGKAVTCSYIRQDNFLEIDVDIGSSSVARSIINLVLGHVTSLVVDMAVLIEAREESELPEYILGTTRVIRVELASAIPYK